MRKPFNGNYPVTRQFGVYDPAYARYPDSKHSGTDYGLPSDTELVASMSGTVTVIDRGTAKTGRGREVVITNGKTQAKYCHMNSFSVKSGDKVVEGQKIGLSGYTGYVMDSKGNIGTKGGAHLHYEILVNGVYVDPEKFKEVNMPEKVSIDGARILGEGILGRDRDAIHAGKLDADLKANHVGKDLTNQYLFNLWTSNEAKLSADVRRKQKNFYNTYATKIAELSARPTKEELMKLGESLKAEQAKVVSAEQKLAEELAKDEATAEENVRGFFGKLIDLVFRKK